MTDPFDAAAAAGHQLQAALAAVQQQLADETAKETADQGQITALTAQVAQLQAQLAAQQPTLPWPFTGYAPTGNGLSHEADLRAAGATDLQSVMVKAGKRVGGVLFDGGDHPYPPNFDNPLGYVSALRHYCLWLEGAADGTTVFRMLGAPFTPYHQPKGGNAYKAMDADDTTPGQTVRGITFTSELRGREYNGYQHAGPNGLIEHCAFLGYHVGSGHVPPHETGGLTTYHSHNLVIRHVLVDCLDPKTGQAVGASPIMLNSSDNVLLEDVEARNAVDGSVTCWSNPNTPFTKWTGQDVRSLNNANGFNFEDYADGAQILLDGCTMKPKAGGAHVQLGSSVGSAKVLVKAPVVDSLPFRVRLIPQEDGKPNLQKQADVTVVDGSGAPLPIRFM